MRISILGSGYVGLVTGLCLADFGYEVLCVDSDILKVNLLNSGKLPLFEPELGDFFLKNRSRLTFSSSVSEATRLSSIIIIAVGTPEGETGQAQLDDLFSTFKEVCLSAYEPKIVAIKSTVPVGTAQRLKQLAAELTPHKIDVVSNPEFLRQGSAVNDFMRPDRLILGSDSKEAIDELKKLYAPLAQESIHGILVMDNNSAELAKYAANSFLALKISYINELALLAREVGADIDSVKRGFTSDHRINAEFFNPGIGYGGSCFSKDIKALLKTGYEQQTELMLLQACEAVNLRQQRLFTNQIIKQLHPLKTKTVGVWGLSFKANTDDVRRSIAISLIEELSSHGAVVKAYDPVAGRNAKDVLKSTFTLCSDKWAAVEDSDALIILTDWSEFKTANVDKIKSELRTPTIFDGRNLLNPKEMREAGFNYFDIGRS